MGDDTFLSSIVLCKNTFNRFMYEYGHINSICQFVQCTHISTLHQAGLLERSTALSRKGLVPDHVKPGS
jgi:hypothetical protein